MTNRRKWVREADKLFSLYIKKKDKNTCVRCHTQYKEGSRGLHNSHFFGRRMMSVRWDERNCDALCHGCHRYWEKEDREGYRAYKVDQLGVAGYNKLDLDAHTVNKTDPYLISQALKSLLGIK